jgi:hypothetical protein
MVDLSISGGNLVLHVRGADNLWALKSSLEIRGWASKPHLRAFLHHESERHRNGVLD